MVSYSNIKNQKIKVAQRRNFLQSTYWFPNVARRRLLQRYIAVPDPCHVQVLNIQFGEWLNIRSASCSHRVTVLVEQRSGPWRELF